MPRPRKCRKICQLPQTREFFPAGDSSCETAVILTVDEYEAIRLIDKHGFSQEECSTYMQVARTTVQMIYNSARKKLQARWSMVFPFVLKAAIISYATVTKNFTAVQDAGSITAVVPQSLLRRMVS